MKLLSVRIENFRAFEDVTVPMSDYTCLVGPNGVGKSTVIAALNVFFGNTVPPGTSATELHEEDFHQRQTQKPIRITLTFNDLSSQACGPGMQERRLTWIQPFWKGDPALEAVQHVYKTG